jgi:hypothetical protein
MDGFKIIIHSSEIQIRTIPRQINLQVISIKMKFRMTNTIGQTIDKHRKKSDEGTEPWGTPENKARGDDLVPSKSTAIERPIQQCEHHIACRSMKIKRQNKLVQK